MNKKKAPKKAAQSVRFHKKLRRFSPVFGTPQTQFEFSDGSVLILQFALGQVNYGFDRHGDCLALKMSKTISDIVGDGNAIKLNFADGSSLTFSLDAGTVH